MRRYRGILLLTLLALAAFPAALALAKDPVVVSGTNWYLTLQTQMKIQKVGGYKDTSDAMLYFGPNGGLSLADDEFMLDVGGGDTYVGNWADPKANGSVILDFDVSELENYLTNDVTQIMENEFASVSDVNIQITKLQTKCKVKPGKNASASLKVSFLGSAMADGELLQGKGSTSAKGKGVQVF